MTPAYYVLKCYNPKKWVIPLHTSSVSILSMTLIPSLADHRYAISSFWNIICSWTIWSRILKKEVRSVVSLAMIQKMELVIRKLLRLMKMCYSRDSVAVLLVQMGMGIGKGVRIEVIIRLIIQLIIETKTEVSTEANIKVKIIPILTFKAPMTFSTH